MNSPETEKTSIDMVEVMLQMVASVGLGLFDGSAKIESCAACEEAATVEILAGENKYLLTLEVSK